MYVPSEEEAARMHITFDSLRLENERIQAEVNTAQMEYLILACRVRPCHSYPVRVRHDGLRWLCQSTTAEEAIGYGDSPAAAMIAFDNMWLGLNNDSVDR
jgi:hypothetical protein